MRKKEDKYDFRAFGLAIKEARLKRGLTRVSILNPLRLNSPEIRLVTPGLFSTKRDNACLLIEKPS